MDELKPCPFCGGEASYTDNFYGNGTGHCVFCEDCGAGTSILTGATPPEELKAMVYRDWNRRVDNGWISVEDALPENSHPVLITWVNNYPVMSCYEKDKGKPFTGCAHYCNGKWYWYSQFSDDILSEYGEYQETVDVDVIAWMPMPDAYEPPEKE